MSDPQGMDDPTDFELMAGLQDQDRRAYFVLKDRYQQRLHHIAEAILNNPQEADEIVQQAFDHVWRQADTFDRERERSVALWLYDLTGTLARAKQKRWLGWLFQRSQSTRWEQGSSVKQLLQILGQLPPVVLISGASLIGVTGITLSYATWATWQLYLKPVGYTTTVASDEDITRIQQQRSTQTLTLRDPYQQSSTLAQVLWSPTNQQILFVATEFPQADRGKTYQLWAEVSTREPSPEQLDPAARTLESAGTFAVPEVGSVQFLSPVLTIPEPNRFFVTLEPRGGSELPEGDIVLVSSYLPALAPSEAIE